MTYAVKICHANDLLRGAWKVVDTFDRLEMSADFIDSPPFEPSDGLIFRIINTKNDFILYESINDTMTGWDTPLLQKYPFDYDDECVNFANEFSLAQMWCEATDPMWLTTWLSRIMPSRESVCVANELAHSVSRLVLSDTYYKRINRWVRGELHCQEFEHDLERLASLCNDHQTNPMIHAGLCAQHSACIGVFTEARPHTENFSIANTCYHVVAQATYNLDSIEAANKSVIAHLHREVPFHRVADWITSK